MHSEGKLLAGWCALAALPRPQALHCVGALVVSCGCQITVCAACSPALSRPALHLHLVCAAVA